MLSKLSRLGGVLQSAFRMPAFQEKFCSAIQYVHKINDSSGQCGRNSASTLIWTGSRSGVTCGGKIAAVAAISPMAPNGHRPMRKGLISRCGVLPVIISLTSLPVPVPMEIPSMLWPAATQTLLSFGERSM